jgi:hypothetical protein
MKKALILLIAVILIVLLNGCMCCPTCPSVPQSCSLTITAGEYVWGTIYINDQSTGQYIDYQSQPTVNVNVSCDQYAKVYIIDTCDNPAQSHTEYIYINKGVNYLYFAYWTEDYVPWWKTKGKNDCHLGYH